MKAISENMVGLFRFIGVLFSVFILPRKQVLETPDEQDKYQEILGQPTVPLIPTEAKFCPECHALVCQIRRTKRGTQIIQSGRVLITAGSITTVKKDGKETRGFPMRCPNGHTVRIE